MARGGIVKPATVLFGEAMPAREVEEAAARSDLVVCGKAGEVMAAVLEGVRA